MSQTLSFPMIQMCEKWENFIKQETDKDYMKKLKSFLIEERKTKKIFPESNMTFEAFRLCPFDKMYAVILGQDPYHTPGHAHGLAFSSISDKRPPSLENIFKEIHSDYFNGCQGVKLFYTNNLSEWAAQGVLLLNTILTVENGTPLSHQDKGWETFTEEVIKKLNTKISPVVFMLWGSHAKKYKSKIASHHLILESAHPEDRSGWFGNKLFTKCSDFLSKHYQRQINWGIFNDAKLTLYGEISASPSTRNYR